MSRRADGEPCAERVGDLRHPAVDRGLRPLAATAVLAGGAQGRARLLVELAQGVLGFAQYLTGLPVLLVGLHLAGACLVLVTAVQAVLALRDRGPLGTPPPPPAGPAATRQLTSA